MKAGGSPAPDYSLKQVGEMLGLSRSVLDRLIDAGFVSAQHGPRGSLHFSFRDLMLLRTAQALREAKIAPARIMRSLTRLRAELPAEMPLTGLCISAIGSQVAVREAGGARDAESGQWLIDFEATPPQGAVAFLPAALPAGREDTARSALQCLAQAVAFESADPAAAEAAYREALALQPGLSAAALNLGALLCEAGRCAEARRVTEAALQHDPASAPLHFNLAIALEDQGETEAAIVHYDRCLELNPELADAHYNAGHLHERMGRQRSAVLHFNAYRRQQAGRP